MAKRGRPKTSIDMEKQCPHCGTMFTVPGWRPKKYCSQGCYTLDRVGKSTTKKGSASEERICENCAIPFVIGGRDGKRKGQRYCSRKCLLEFRGHIATKNAERAGDYSNTFVPVEKCCKTCGETFMVQVRSKSNATYCSRTCAQERLRRPRTHKLPSTLSSEEVAWLAALIDGEGSILMSKSKTDTGLRLNISNTHGPLVSKIAEVTGTGRIGEVHRGGNRKLIYNWQCYGDNARNLIRQMLPWLIVKKDKALEVLNKE